VGRDKARDVVYASIHDPAMGDKCLAEMLRRRGEVIAALGQTEILQVNAPANILGLGVMIDRVLAGARPSPRAIAAFRTRAGSSVGESAAAADRAARVSAPIERSRMDFGFRTTASLRV
jgi:hypothetical protein